MSGIKHDLSLRWSRDRDGTYNAAHVGFWAFIKKADLEPGYWFFYVEEEGDSRDRGLECKGRVQTLKKAKDMVALFMFKNMRHEDRS